MPNFVSDIKGETQTEVEIRSLRKVFEPRIDEVT
jgi:hypothetical protein